MNSLNPDSGGITTPCAPPQPIAFEYAIQARPACEILLPELFRALEHKGHTRHIEHVATLSEPGPFTAVRAGLSFARGLSCGVPAWSFFSTSLFELLPKDKNNTVLETGPNHWIDARGNMFQEPQKTDKVVSFATGSLDQMMLFSEKLALYAMRAVWHTPSPTIP